MPHISSVVRTRSIARAPPPPMEVSRGPASTRGAGGGADAHGTNDEGGGYEGTRWPRRAAMAAGGRDRAGRLGSTHRRVRDPNTGERSMASPSSKRHPTPTSRHSEFTSSLRFELIDAEERALVGSYAIASAIGLAFLLLVQFGPQMPPVLVKPFVENPVFR